MFAVGDMHASMGDGEICFTGVEIAGEVDIRFDVLKGKQATWPVTELADRWLPHATAYDYADALQLVCEEAARMLVDEHGFTMEDAFIFLSVACDAGVAQACKPAEGPRTLAERLRALEAEGIVERHSYPESPPRVEYELTDKGESLLPIIDAMRDFGHQWLPCHHQH